MNIDQAWHRYNNDAEFNSLVTTLRELMHRMKFTYGELRNATFLAAVQIEENRTVPRKIGPWYPRKKNKTEYPVVPRGEYFDG